MTKISVTIQLVDYDDLTESLADDIYEIFELYSCDPFIHSKGDKVYVTIDGYYNNNVELFEEKVMSALLSAGYECEIVDTEVDQ